MQNIKFKVTLLKGVAGLDREGIFLARQSVLENRYDSTNSQSFLNGVDAVLNMLEISLNEENK